MAIRIKSAADFRRLLEELALELVDANIYLRLHNDLKIASGRYQREFRQSRAFWSLTLQAHFDAALFRLCRIFDQHPDGLNLRNFLETIQENIGIFAEKDFPERLKGNPFVDSLAASAQRPREHVEEFAELRARLEELETRVRGQDSVGPIAEHLAQVNLAPLLIQFLEEFRPKAFSPLKIHRWGGRQHGYEKLATYTKGATRSVLQDLVSSGKVAVRVSRLGNTLYRIAE